MTRFAIFLIQWAASFVFFLSSASASTSSEDLVTAELTRLPSHTLVDSPLPSTRAEPRYPAEAIVGSVYYVAPYGNDSHSKSQAANASTPWRTLQKAADNAVAGDTVIVKDGVYTRSGSTYLVTFRRSGTAEKPIRFLSQNRWGAVLDGGYDNFSMIATGGQSHVIIEGFEMRHGERRAIHGNDNPGGAHITVRGNWIHDNGNHQITSDTGGRVGLYSGQRERYWIVENNIIHTNGRPPGANDPNHDPTHDYRHDHGYYAQGHGHIVRNNIFFDHTAGWDIKVDGSMVTGTFNENERTMVIVNNTFASRRPAGQSSGQIRFYRNGNEAPRNVLIMNNVFWNTAGEAPILTGLGGWPWVGAEVINNITSADRIVRDIHTDDFLTLEGNVTNLTHPGIRGTTLGMASPKSIGAVASDFALTPQATLLIDRGRAAHARSGLPTVTAPTKDHAGTNRPQGSARDLGAFEWKQ